MTIQFTSIVPILRIFDIAKADENRRRNALAPTRLTFQQARLPLAA
jgi:hypothetical protein